MRQPLNCSTFFFLVIFCSCGVVNKPTKYGLESGIYKTKLIDQKKQKVYLNTEQDSFHVYALQKGTPTVIDTSVYKRLSFQKETKESPKAIPVFSQPSFDVDFLTIPFKYRPPTSDFPRQFNTSLNGAVYLGYRNDIYNVKYQSTPLSIYKRRVTHYGISVGGFLGLGSTFMSPSVTNNSITTEYDGMVFSKGIAGIIGINKFTIGIALGFDNLLDNNKNTWIYQQKPWLGLAFGLNLN